MGHRNLHIQSILDSGSFQGFPGDGNETGLGVGFMCFDGYRRLAANHIDRHILSFGIYEQIFLGGF